MKEVENQEFNQQVAEKVLEVLTRAEENETRLNQLNKDLKKKEEEIVQSQGEIEKLSNKIEEQEGIINNLKVRLLLLNNRLKEMKKDHNAELQEIEAKLEKEIQERKSIELKLDLTKRQKERIEGESKLLQEQSNQLLEQTFRDLSSLKIE